MLKVKELVASHSPSGSPQPSTLGSPFAMDDLQSGDEKEESLNDHGDNESKERQFWRPGERIMVGIYIGVEKLNQINVVTHTFGCSFKIEMQWPVSKVDLENWSKDKVNYTPQFVPRFEIPNILNQETKEILTDGISKTGYRVFEEGGLDNWGTPLTDLRYPYLNACLWTIEGLFSEQFEIQRFPMDCQDLEISILAIGQTVGMCFSASLSIIHIQLISV